MKYTNEERQWIETYRLPSFRWRKRRIIKGKDKRLIQLRKESDKIRMIIENLGFEELETPIRKGYERLFVLREDVRENKKSDFYQNILNKINTYRYSNEKKFAKRKRKKRLSKHKYKLAEIQQILLEPEKHHFEKLTFKEDEKKLFILIQYYDYQSRKWKEKYVFSEPWRFVLKVRPYFITKIRKKDWELEKRRDEIDRIIYEDKINSLRLQKIKSRSNRWKSWLGEKEKYQLNPDPTQNIPLSKIWESYEEEKHLN
ncbi:hypothetical protein O2K51_06810 [Apibacter raozihei]|uniref:hypothetical protein n=1 Tax=Apibacter raozihei TaxID=2500547 RepID=UPI000FE306B5|nr:hypothetical protein [Apibacter raozihei]